MTKAVSLPNNETSSSSSTPVSGPSSDASDVVAQALSLWTEHVRETLTLHPRPLEKNPLGGVLPQLAPLWNLTDPTDANRYLSVYLQNEAHEPAPISAWELVLLARAYSQIYTKQIRDLVEELRELGAGAWSSVEMPMSLLRQINLAVSVFHDAFEPGNSIRQELELLRQSLFLVQEAAFSDQLLAQSYFSLEYKAAVFLPVVLPAIVPLLGLVKLALARRAGRKGGA